MPAAPHRRVIAPSGQPAGRTVILPAKGAKGGGMKEGKGQKVRVFCDCDVVCRWYSCEEMGGFPTPTVISMSQGLRFRSD